MWYILTFFRILIWDIDETVQLHLVHWNEDLCDSYEEASRREDGIVILGIFVTVGNCFVCCKTEKRIKKTNFNLTNSSLFFSGTTVQGTLEMYTVSGKIRLEFILTAFSVVSQ